MIIDIYQTKYTDDVSISYIDKNRDRQIIEIKKRDFWKWRYSKNSISEPNIVSYDNKPVVKTSYKDSDIIDKKSIWEYINTHPYLQRCFI